MIIGDASHDTEEIRSYNAKRGIKSIVPVNPRNLISKKRGRPKKFRAHIISLCIDDLEGFVMSSFRNVVFILPKSQEEACRRARKVLAEAGNRDEEEYHRTSALEVSNQQQ